MSLKIYLSYDVVHDQHLIEKFFSDIDAYHLDWQIVGMTENCNRHIDLIKQDLETVDLIVFLCGFETRYCRAINLEYELCLELGKPYFFLNGYNQHSITLPDKAYPSAISYLWHQDNIKLLGGKYQVR